MKKRVEEDDNNQKMWSKFWTQRGRPGKWQLSGLEETNIYAVT